MIRISPVILWLVITASTQKTPETPADSLRKLQVAIGKSTDRIAIRENSFEPQSPELADALNTRGHVHAIRAIDRANDMSAVWLRKETLGAGMILGDTEAAFDAMRTTDRANEAIAELEGELAESCYKRALAIREKILKPDDPAIADTIFNLGQLAVGLHRMKDCVPYFERWLALQDKVQVPPSERQGKVLWWVSCAVIEQKDFDKAERLLSRAQAVFEKIKGTDADVLFGILSTAI